MFLNKAITPSNIGSYTKSLILLMKPRVMSLVIFTCAVGFLTSDPNIKTLNAIISIALVAIGAGAAGCLNMWYEADVDALMTRTCLRPIPTGKVNKQQALIFGILLTIFSVGTLYIIQIFCLRSFYFLRSHFTFLSIRFGLKEKLHKTL